MRGSCLCGAVQFQADPPLRDVVVCHCTQCRKASGHVWAATSVPLDRFHLLRDEALAWYRSSDLARRGYCATCGSTLFWEKLGEGRISISAGALDGPSGLSIASEWFLADAGDYYSGSAAPADTLHGACLCSANRFSLPGPMGPVTACHCTQCRKTSGHYAASFDTDEKSVQWLARATREFTTPGGGQRGFCPTCGSSLYFRAKDGAFSVEAGTIDTPTGGHLAEHIFTADKGDYYTLDDGLPQTA